MVRRLSRYEIWNIKKLICEGLSQTDVARVLDISQGSVSKICLGDLHRDIPWPNLKIGDRLMRDRGARGETPGVQAQLMSEALEKDEWQQEFEEEAVQKARDKAENNEKVKEEMQRRIVELEEEQEREFKAAMIGQGDKPAPLEQKELKELPSAWEAQFIAWDKILKDAGHLDMVKAIEDATDTEEDSDMLKRAIGIVFFTREPEEWGTDQTVRLVSTVVKQLSQSRKDAK